MEANSTVATTTTSPASTRTTTTSKVNQTPNQQQVFTSPLRKATSSVTSTSSNYLSNLVNKSSILFDSLKQQFNANQTTGATSAGHQINCTNNNNNNNDHDDQQQQAQRELSTNHYHNYKTTTTTTTTTTAGHQQDNKMHSSEANLSSSKLIGRQQQQQQQQQQQNRHRQPIQRSTTTLNRDISSASSGSGNGATECVSAAADVAAEAPQSAGRDNETRQRPPLPPPPPRELVLQVTGQHTHATSGGPGPSSPVARRHALQEHSLERDALTSCGEPASRKLAQHTGGGTRLMMMMASTTTTTTTTNEKPKESTSTGGKAHKRAASIKSALRHAHLGPLRPSASKRRTNAEKQAAREAAANFSAGGAAHELFEPPITQRTFQRQTRRRGAMQSDPRRQMSVDTIGLRQLTDEYLENAGVKPSATSGQCSLVALKDELRAGSGPGQMGAGGPSAGATIDGSSSVVAAVAAATSAPGNSLAAAQAQCALEAQLYQAARLAAAKLESMAAGSESKCSSSARGSARPSYSFQHQSSCGPSIGGGAGGGTGAAGGNSHLCSCTSQTSADTDSLSHVTILPGGLPWQCDVSIQCELLRAPPMLSDEPYETTGDILDTIARPFRGSSTTGSGAAASFDSPNSSHHHHHHYHLSATLKRGLSAISQSHHLSPNAGGSSSGLGGGGGAPMTATLNVVGSLKKSLSNTLDISKSNHHLRAADLHSQDSLPNYSTFINEPDDDDDDGGGGGDDDSNSNCKATDHDHPDDVRSRGAYERRGDPAEQHPKQHQQQPQEGFINQLASKLTRQSSKKFSVSKKGLQRALSFDCRGYKRLDGQPAGGLATSGPSTSTTNQRHATTTSGQDSTGSSNSNGGLFGSRSRNTTTGNNNHKSTLALHSPRPYLPQSASQVDFQVPLLPFDKMQEAIVSQRLLDPLPGGQVGGARGASRSEADSAGCEQQLDADELICGPTQKAPIARDSVESSRRQSAESQTSHHKNNDPLDDHHQQARCRARHHHHHHQSGSQSNRSSLGAASTTSANSQQQPPRLVLNIPTIATTDDDDGQGDTIDETNNEDQKDSYRNHQEQPNTQTVLTSPNLAAIIDSTPFTCQHQDQRQQQQQQQQQTHLNVAGGMSQSPSFCIDTEGKTYLISQSGSSQSNQLTASDVFNRSKNFIKRPSTMVADNDAMNQVAQALESSSSGALGGSIRRTNRRQAIVPPKLATDANSGSDSEREPKVGQLIDVDDEADDLSDADDDHDHDHDDGNQIDDDSDELNLLQSNRRKRSGGSNGATHQPAATEATGSQQRQGPQHRSRARALSGSQGQLPAYPAEVPDLCVTSAAGGRPDSQATNADSLVSSGSSTTLSAYASGRLSATGATGGLGAANLNNSSLSVPFAGGSSSRRRSSIAVIPQMQICPGDLLVYSKQLIDRMNQSDENEPPAQFLTIDDKKAKNNIWSSFKLCAQFDNRTMRARNQLLCSLEDVLASLQPSTFVDEQLSHYKGMLWNEFLYETESRRSASSEGANSANEAEEETNNTNPKKVTSYKDDLVGVEVRISAPSPKETPVRKQQQQHHHHRRSGSMKGNEDISDDQQQQQASREPIKVTMSGSGTPIKQTPSAGRFSSRFREKPKLKRGQTVDSVFRIPLIPSSPLKHAQQHQQTPTAHLEEHSLITIEDDERSSLSGGATSQGDGSPPVLSSTGGAHLDRRKRSSSTRSRSQSRHNQHQQLPVVVANGNNAHDPQQQQQHQLPSQESSFEADDALDLINGTNNNNNNNKWPHRNKRSTPSTTPNQIVRQSSLSTLSSTITRTEQKRQRALWDLFQSECAFFFDHLMTLKNVYMEPLKKIQVEGFAMFADPDVLFGNLDELCCGVYDFCKEFLYIIMRTLKTRPEELNATDVLIKLYKKNPKIDHLRAVYHRYTLNYINALTYLESLRRQVEFVEFEKWSSRDVRCKKLQLTDLLVAPVQHIMRVPIILKDIESNTEHKHDRDEIRAILAVEEASLRELDDKMRWLKNFERLLEIQKNISWPSVLDMDAKLYVPEFLKEVLSKQPCEKLIVSPRRQIVHEGTLSNFDLGGKPSDLHVILFDDMLLLTRKKKGLTKKASTVCKTNSGGSSALKDDGSFKYIVYKQPLSLDRFYVHDVQQVDAQAIGIKHLFLLIVLNRFQQIINVHSFSAPNDDMKQTWLFKLKKTAERWKRNNSGISNDQQKQQQQQQQQQISPSKSMPVDSRPNRPASQRSPARQTTGDNHQQEPSRVVIDQQPDGRSPSATSTPSRNAPGGDNNNSSSKDNQINRTDDQRRLSVSQPIELIVTSACESPNEMQTVSNASTVITNTTRCNKTTSGV